MGNHNKRKNLVLKQVTAEYASQVNDLFRYVFQVTNSELEEGGYEDGELLRSKYPVFERSDVLGWFDGDKLISQLLVYDCKVNMHGCIMPMGGLTGVGTYPEYAGFGLMTELISLALQRMRAKGQLISYLYPYSIPYYRRKGWEIISEHIIYNLKDNQIPKYENIEGMVKRLPVTHPDVLKLYHEFFVTTHGAMQRGNQEWAEYWKWENEDERIAGIYYDENDVPQGMLFYWIANDIFHIKDMIYLNQEARKGLWNFIHAHMSMIDSLEGHIYKNEPIAFLLSESDIQEKIEPYFMARIVDVQNFLTQYPFKKIATAFHFQVSDPIAEWNNGIFSVHPTENGFSIGSEEIGEKVELGVHTLTAMLMSIRWPSYFLEIERLKCSKNCASMLDNIIPSTMPYFSDYF